MDNKEEITKVKDTDKDLCETKIDEMFKILVGLEITKPETAKVAATINRWLLAILDCHKQDVEVLRKRVEELEKEKQSDVDKQYLDKITALQVNMYTSRLNQLQTQARCMIEQPWVQDASLYNYLLSNCRSNIATELNAETIKNTCARFCTPTDDYV